MKEKPDVLQGTLALMVLKTLDVLGPQHGYGNRPAHRADQRRFSGGQPRHSLSLAAEAGAGRRDCLRVGRIGEQPPGALLSPDRDGPQTAASGDPGLGANRGDHRPVLRGEGGGFVMRFLRRFLARLKNFATGRRDDQRLREEMEEHLRSADRGESPRRHVARGGAPPGGAEVWRGAGGKGKLSRGTGAADDGESAAGHDATPCACLPGRPALPLPRF